MKRDMSHVPIVRSDHAPGEGLSIMEFVADACGEEPRNEPSCASPVLREWMIAWADELDDVERQDLRRYVPSLATSRAALPVETARQWLVVD